MTDRPTDLTTLPSFRQPRSLLSARKFALMASVVALTAFNSASTSLPGNGDAGLALW